MGNQVRANEALDRVLLASRTGQGPFRVYSLPQECRNYPVNLRNERDLANFLFVSLLHQSGGNDAEASLRGHRRLYERWPEIYDPRTAVNYSADEIREMMKAVGLTLYNKEKGGGRRPEWLLHNAEVLNRCWGGDPRNIFKGLPCDKIEAWNVLLSRIATRGSPDKLFGFQEKVASLFVHFFVDAHLIEPFDVPPPVDLHQCRFFGGLELVNQGDVVGPWKDLNSFRDLVRTIYAKYAYNRGITMLEVGEAVWYYSREMCKYAPGAYTANGLYVGAAQLTVDSGKRKLQGKPYAETCGNCIVSDLCKWNMPHTYHYNRGRKQGGLVFVPRPSLPDESPLLLDLNAATVVRCSRHQGKFWATDASIGCIGCGGCGTSLDLPVRLRNNGSKHSS